MRYSWLLISIMFPVDGCVGCSPTEPTEIEEDKGKWECERFLTHPIRNTYALRCVNDVTGEVQIRDDIEN